MEGLNEIVQQIANQHTPMREEMVVWNHVLPIINNGTGWDQLNAMLSFYVKYLPRHFKEEELFIDVLLKDSRIDADSRATLNKLVTEHEYLNNIIVSLMDSIKVYPTHDRPTRERFLDSMYLALETLTTHANIEDKVLFPLCSRFLSKEQLQDLDTKLKSM